MYLNVYQKHNIETSTNNTQISNITIYKLYEQYKTRTQELSEPNWLTLAG